MKTNSSFPLDRESPYVITFHAQNELLISRNALWAVRMYVFFGNFWHTSLLIYPDTIMMVNMSCEEFEQHNIQNFTKESWKFKSNTSKIKSEQKLLMSSRTQRKRSPGFYAGCNTSEKKKFRRERNTKSVREYRQRQKELNLRRQVMTNNNKNELLNLLDMDNCCSAIAEFETKQKKCKSDPGRKEHETRIQLLTRLLDVETVDVTVWRTHLFRHHF